MPQGRVGKPLASGQREQVGAWSAEELRGRFERVLVVHEPTHEYEWDGEPLRWHDVGRPKLEVAPRPHFREQGREVRSPVGGGRAAVELMAERRRGLARRTD